jgi:hypothetical protein
MSIFLRLGRPKESVPVRGSRNIFVTGLFFKCEGLLAPRPTPKLEDHSMSFVRGCLFNIFPANLQLEAVASIRNPRTRDKGTHLTWN